MAKKVLIPPKKHVVEYYEYLEVSKYLEKLHGKNFRDYAGKFSNGKTNNVPYQDFWHVLCDHNDMANGSFIHLPDWDYYMNNATTESWRKEIMQLFHDFLGEDYHEKMWVEW